MGLRPEKQDQLRCRCAAANLLGEPAEFMARFLSRQHIAQIDPPSKRARGQDRGKAGDKTATDLYRSIVALGHAAEEPGSSGISREQVVRALEPEAREENNHYGQPGQTKACLGILLPPPATDDQPDPDGQHQTPR